MKQRMKGWISIILAITVAVTLLPQIERTADKVQAAVTTVEVSDMETLIRAVELCNSPDTVESVEATLTNDITELVDTISITSGMLSIDLNGHTLSGNTKEYTYLIESSGGDLTITDNSGGKTGTIQNTNSLGGVINKTGGTLNISGGTFDSAYRALNVEYSQVKLSGGTFNGGIANRISETAGLNYTSYYDRENGLIADGYVLTDNTFTDDGEITVFSAAKVSVVNGALLELDTRRSMIETYSDNETAEAETADLYSIAPASVGADGTIYPNSGSSTTPVIDSSRVTNGNTYVFKGWCDENNMEYASMDEYISSQGVPKTDSWLSAVWTSKTTSSEGLESAIENYQAVGRIELLNDISLSDSLVEKEADSYTERTLDLGGKTIYYSSDSTESPALILNGAWSIQNGTIESKGQACLQIDGTAVLENLDCKAQDSSYVVGFGNVSTNSQNKIASGTFETTAADGCTIWTVNSSGTGTASDITSLFGNAYPSSTNTRIDGANVYLNAPKLLVSQSPITYIENGGDVDMGTHTYGEDIPAKKQTISNQQYMGDIVITGVSIDNPAFSVTGESASKSLAGKSTDTYSYTIKAVEKKEPGTYKGTVSVNYTRMDGTTDVYRQSVTMKIVKKPLTVGSPELEKTKVYDGTKTAKVTPGTLKGIVSGDKVSIKAKAVYDNANAGTGKTITVKYTLAGADKDKYEVPEKTVFSDGTIKKAKGNVKVTLENWLVGENAKEPVVSSSTNDSKTVVYYYKQKDALEDAYSREIPAEEGTYTIKAILKESTNYEKAEAESEFTISYIETPENPYFLTGTDGKNGWYVSPVTIQAAEGYTISFSRNGTYTQSVVLNESIQGASVYLKSASGAVTRPISLEKIQIDGKAPVISEIEDGETYFADEFNVIIEDENLAAVYLNGERVEVTGTRERLLLKPSRTKYTISAEDIAGNSVTTSFKLYEAWMREGIVSSGIKYLVSNMEYKLGSGQWKIDGDNTVYNGGTNFYVYKDGAYDFQKQ